MNMCCAVISINLKAEILEVTVSVFQDNQSNLLHRSVHFHYSYIKTGMIVVLWIIVYTQIAVQSDVSRRSYAVSFWGLRLLKADDFHRRELIIDNSMFIADELRSFAWINCLLKSKSVSALKSFDYHPSSSQRYCLPDRKWKQFV